MLWNIKYYKLFDTMSAINVSNNKVVQSYPRPVIISQELTRIYNNVFIRSDSQ